MDSGLAPRGAPRNDEIGCDGIKRRLESIEKAIAATVFHSDQLAVVCLLSLDILWP
jgi:hypothetical protein